MASARPSTPLTPKASAPSTPQAGSWKHPKFEEITRRQNASTFSDRNVKQIVYNFGGVVAIWFMDKFVKAYIPTLYLAFTSLRPWSGYAYMCFQIILIYNILVALLPLLRPKDDISDIPLTPAQRKLLGLPPSSTPATPGSAYITPPRFARSSTPLSGSPTSLYSKSPASGRESPATPGRGSSFSPNASPLLHKAMGGFNARRTSYGSLSPLGPGPQKGWSEAPSTPSPSSAKGVSVGLNNKWLYEKGRGSPVSGGLFS